MDKIDYSRYEGLDHDTMWAKGLYNLNHYIKYENGSSTVCLDCDFTKEELRAIANWMEDHGG